MPDRTYTDAIREAAVARVAAGDPVQQVARETGIPRSTLRRWVDAFEEGGGLVIDAQDKERQRRRDRIIDNFLEISELAGELLREGLGKVDIERATIKDLQSLAIINGIAVQRAQDMTEERWPAGEGGKTLNVVFLKPPTRDERQALAEPGNVIDGTALPVVEPMQARFTPPPTGPRRDE